MKFIFAGLAALLGTVDAAANPVKDLSKGTWWVFKEDWKKYYHLKEGKELFVEGCNFRIGSLDNGRDNASGSFYWSHTDKGDRKLIVKRNNRNSKHITFTKDKDGVYTAGRAGRMWKIWNTAGYAKATDFAGNIKDCATKTTKFQTAKKDLAIAVNKVASSTSFEKCGQAVATECVGTTVEMTEAGWQQFSDEVTDTAGFLIKATEAMAKDMSFTMKRGLNSLKCAVTGAGSNMWNLFGAVYYAALEFGYSAELVKYVDEYYPYVCTCQKETEALSELFGGDESTASVMGGCSEKVQQSASDLKEIAAGGLPEEDDIE